MSCDPYEVGSKIEAIGDFQVQESLAAPVGANLHEIHVGDRGEVTQRRRAGNFHWLIVRWDHINRTINLDGSLFDQVKLVEG